jgi:hypothetical protein
LRRSRAFEKPPVHPIHWRELLIVRDAGS